jgi:hypothetical protein
MAVLNLFGYAVLVGPRRPRNIEVALVVITLMIAAGYVALLVRIMIVGEAAVAPFLVYCLNAERARAFFQR